LFFAPAQRAQLDAVRAQRDRRLPVTQATQGGDTTEQPGPQGPDVVTYNGMVRRSDGKSTVWINGKPINERSRDSDVSVLGMRRDGAVSVAVPQAERSVSLRVGQSVDITSGTIEEPYARRATIPIPRPPAKPAAPAPAADAAAKPPAVATAAQKTARRNNRDVDPESGAIPPAERNSK